MMNSQPPRGLSLQEKEEITETWLRVYYHELSRRERHFQDHPKAYLQVYGRNLKPLDKVCCEGKHTWVPATVVWIHDGIGRNTSVIGKFKRRGLHEGMPYKWNGYQVIPQVCWNCRQTRELLIQQMTPELRRTLRSQIEIESQGKPKGKMGSGRILDEDDFSIFDV